MHRAPLSAMLIALAVLAGVVVLIGSRGAAPPAVHALSTTHYVAAGGCGGMTPCYSTIQAAIDAAQAGDVIKVAAGDYATLNAHGGLSQIAYITRSLTLQGGYTTTDWTTPNPAAHVTTLDATGGGRAVYIAGAITVTVDGLHLTGGDATGLGGSPWADGGGGICVLTATVTLSRNTIEDNVACQAAWAEGVGGGIYLHQSNALVVSNTIAGNTAARASGAWSTSDGSGGGLYAEGGAPVLQGNHLLNNVAATGANLFNMGDGGGLCFEDSQPTVRANWIQENQAPGVGGGVSLRGCPDFTLINNLIADNQATEGYGGAGVDAGHISGIGSRGHLIHTTIVRNLGPEGTSGVRIEGGAVVTLTNTILAGHDTGIDVSFGSTATLTATLWADNDADWDDVGAIYTGALNYWGDPAFMDPDAGNYHISSASAARDRGVAAGVPTDLDGVPRDAPPDLGAYEAGAAGALQIVKRASVARLNPGDTVVYTLVVTNAGLSSMTHVAVQDDLPVLQRPLHASSDVGTCTIVNSGYGGRVTCAISSLGGHQAAHITITAQATASAPATLPQTMRNQAQASSDQAAAVATYADTTLHNCRACVNGAGPVYGTVQAAVAAASPGAVVWIAGTCAGADAGQQVLLAQDLALRGGYRADFGAWDPAAYPTTLDALGQGRVVYVAGPASVTLAALTLTGGDATGRGSDLGALDDAGGGLYAVTATVTLSATHVTANVASTQYPGLGGGVGVATTTLTLIGTTLDHNTGSTSMFGMGHGGGLAAERSTVRLENSRLEHNVAGPFFGEGGGAYVAQSALDADATIWYSNTASASGWGLGGGLYVAGAAPFALTNCVLAENQSNDGSGAGGSGLAVEGASGVLLHPTIAGNRGSEGVSLSYSSTLAITNAIVVSHSVGIRATDGSAATVNGVLWHDNVANTATITGTVQVTNAITGSPAFEPDGYHITPGSPARDQGVVSGVPTDIDGQARPFGPAYDLGADEYACYVVTGVGIAGPASGAVSFAHTFTATVGPVTATQPITYTWKATGQADIVHAGGIADAATFTWNVTGPQSVTVTAVNRCGTGASATHAITITNQPPVAAAGANQTVTVGSLVTLDGRGSHDPDGHLPLAYGWTQTGGPAVGGPWAVVQPTFTAPGAPAILTFSLMVTDSVGLRASASAGVRITVISDVHCLYLPLVLRH